MIEIEGVSKSFGETPVLDDISLRVDPGEVVSCVGPSGCGKTTLLHILSGIMPADSGSFHVSRPSGIVFQEPRLLPWRTVRGNIRIIEDLGGIPVSEELIDDLLDVVSIDDGSQYPTELSGGMKQRIGFARALAVDPEVLLLDEPLASLDYHLRQDLKDHLTAAIDDRDLTTLFVTHNLADAMDLADRIIVLDQRPARILAEYSDGDVEQTEIEATLSSAYPDPGA